MNTLAQKAFLLTSIALGALAIVPSVRASEMNQRTVLTFHEPVEIPGQILPAGTYVFKLANSPSSRQIVQVFNKEENKVFGTFLTIPDYRLKPSDETVIRFEERAAASPQAIKAWFYPGRSYGHEFVYPKKEAVELAKANDTPVPAMPAELEPMTTSHTLVLTMPQVHTMLVAPLKAEEPTGEEVELATEFAGAPAGELPEQLPATGTALPLIGLMGLMSLATGATLQLVARRGK